MGSVPTLSLGEGRQKRLSCPPVSKSRPMAEMGGRRAVANSSEEEPKAANSVQVSSRKLILNAPVLGSAKVSSGATMQLPVFSGAGVSAGCRERAERSAPSTSCAQWIFIG